MYKLTLGGLCCASLWSFQTTHTRVTTDVSPIPRSRNGSTALRAEMDCAALLPTVSVCRMSTGTRRRATIVRIQGEWIVVPDAAVVTEPNRFGPAVVWPYNDRYGNTRIRCFIPGAGT